MPRRAACHTLPSRRMFTAAVCCCLPWPLQGVRLIDHFSREVVDDIFACALKKQTGVSLKYMSVYARRARAAALGAGGSALAFADLAPF